MRPIALLCLIAWAGLAGCAHTAAVPEADLATVLANPARSAADRERDGRDQPAAVLAFAGFRRGERIADIFGGGGYYSEILSGVVGDEGEIYLVNNPPYDNYAKKDLTPRLADQRLRNVRYAVRPNDDLQLPKDLDGALIVMSYHDLYHAAPDQGWAAIDAGQFIEQITAALKPGGVLLIVDHASAAGRGKLDADSLHRIEESFAIADFKAHGLVFDGKLDVLRAAADDHSKNVFDPAIRGMTDRFVHRYRKPR